MREDSFRRSVLPSDSTQVPEYLARRLNEAYKRFLKTAPSNSYTVVDKDGWHRRWSIAIGVYLKTLIEFGEGQL